MKRKQGREVGGRGKSVSVKKNNNKKFREFDEGTNAGAGGGGKHSCSRSSPGYLIACSQPP